MYAVVPTEKVVSPHKPVHCTCVDFVVGLFARRTFVREATSFFPGPSSFVRRAAILQYYL